MLIISFIFSDFLVINLTWTFQVIPSVLYISGRQKIILKLGYEPLQSILNHNLSIMWSPLMCVYAWNIWKCVSNNKLKGFKSVISLFSYFHKSNYAFFLYSYVLYSHILICELHIYPFSITHAHTHTYEKHKKMYIHVK